MSINIFGAIALISQVSQLAQNLRALDRTLGRAISDPVILGELKKSPTLSHDIADISAKIRAVENSAAAVGKDKNIGSKISEVQRLVAHVQDLVSALTSDTSNPAVLAEVAASPTLQSWLGDIVSDWTAVQTEVRAFRL